MEMRTMLTPNPLLRLKAALLASVRGGGHLNATGKFFIDPSEFIQLVLWLKELANQNGVRVEIVTPDRMKLVIITSGTVIACTAAGAMLAGVPGAVVGCGVGLCAGYGIAHLRLTWDGDAGTLLLS
jgi:hypothetical protein